jgi:hypothetical protein
LLSPKLGSGFLAEAFAIKGSRGRVKNAKPPRNADGDDDNKQEE